MTDSPKSNIETIREISQMSENQRNKETHSQINTLNQWILSGSNCLPSSGNVDHCFRVSSEQDLQEGRIQNVRQNTLHCFS
jgi:DNA-directed RNA polymerase subunit L